MYIFLFGYVKINLKRDDVMEEMKITKICENCISISCNDYSTYLKKKLMKYDNW
jgi:hypothetical protein